MCCKPQRRRTTEILLQLLSFVKLSDFGLAVMDGAQNKNNIKLSGTLGYVAPEYLLDGMYIERNSNIFLLICLLHLLGVFLLLF